LHATFFASSRSDTIDSAFGGMIAFCIIIGDSIPHVITAVVPNIDKMPVLWLLANRRAIIAITTMGISYPLTLYRDIAKVCQLAAVQTIRLLTA
jgi:sodium-coupled neutral amino acid transporter 11